MANLGEIYSREGKNKKQVVLFIKNKANRIRLAYFFIKNQKINILSKKRISLVKK
jgi:hypothetical protein